MKPGPASGVSASAERPDDIEGGDASRPTTRVERGERSEECDRDPDDPPPPAAPRRTTREVEAEEHHEDRPAPGSGAWTRPRRFPGAGPQAPDSALESWPKLSIKPQEEPGARVTGPRRGDEETEGRAEERHRGQRARCRSTHCPRRPRDRSREDDRRPARGRSSPPRRQETSDRVTGALAADRLPGRRRAAVREAADRDDLVSLLEAGIAASGRGRSTRGEACAIWNGMRATPLPARSPETMSHAERRDGRRRKRRGRGGPRSPTRAATSGGASIPARGPWVPRPRTIQRPRGPGDQYPAATPSLRTRWLPRRRRSRGPARSPDSRRTRRDSSPRSVAEAHEVAPHLAGTPLSRWSVPPVVMSVPVGSLDPV